MKPGMKLAILLIGAVAVWSGIFFFACSSTNPTKRAKVLAEKSLSACVDNPESIVIKAVGEPDSVFGNEYVTMDEKMAIAMSMLKVSKKVMDDTDNLDSIEAGDSNMSALMERQMSALSALRALTSWDSPDSNKAKPFSGWKVKIEYEAESDDGSPYRSEYWFILNKDADCVVKSFEIPLL